MINELNAIGYCSEDISLIENYKEACADITQTWICHHKRELTEEKSCEQLIREHKYFQVPANELIFLSPSQHRSEHNKSIRLRSKISKRMTGRIVSQETRDKISRNKKGKPSWNKGKKKSQIN